MPAKVLRWEVPINNKDVDISFAGEISPPQLVFPLLKTPYLEFWSFVEDEMTAVRKRTFRVFPTGVDVPDIYWMMGTSNRVNNQVYHLFEKPSA